MGVVADDGLLHPATFLKEEFTLGSFFFTDLTPGGAANDLGMKASHTGTELVFRLTTLQTMCAGLNYRIVFAVRSGNDFGSAEFSTDPCPLYDGAGHAELYGAGTPQALPGDVTQSLAETVSHTTATIAFPVELFGDGVYAIYGVIDDGVNVQFATDIVHVRIIR